MRTSGADWNWAAGSDWGTAAEAVSGWPPAAAQWPPQVEAATPPWMAAAQPAWPSSSSAWPGAAGAAPPTAPPGLRSMTPAGVCSLSPAPVTTKNRFAAFSDRNIVDSNGAALDRDGSFDLLLFVKPAVKLSKPSKKRKGRRPLSCIGTSASTASGNMFPPAVKSMNFQCEKTLPVDPALIWSPILMALGAPRLAALPLHRRIALATVTNTLVRPSLVLVLICTIILTSLILAYVVLIY